jgi:zinc transport system substrate-binding protein
MILFVIVGLSSCNAPVNNEDGKLSIVTTIFPVYDFIKQIAGDKVNVIMLLPPGVESHSYEPTPSDIIEIENADMFFYISEHTETWVSRITSVIRNDEVKLICLADAVGIEIHGHNHEHGEDHSHTNECETDEHIWTNLDTSAQLVSCIGQKIAEADEQNKYFYLNNAENYKSDILKLKDDFSEMISQSERKLIVSGSRFAMKNFTAQFGLEYIAAFDSCVDNTEPSAGVMAKIIDTITKSDIPVIFYEELTEPKIARAVSLETGAKMLLLHSCHNVSAQELENGATYISLMKQNYNNIKEALN